MSSKGEYEIAFTARLRSSTIDDLAREWRVAVMFPASEYEMDAVISEFKDRRIKMDPVVADYQRRFAEERKPRWEICHGEGGLWLPLNVDEFFEANADSMEITEGAIYAMLIGMEIRYGGGATPLVAVRRVR